MEHSEADVLLVENSQDDIDLTMRTLRQENLGTNVEVLRDGEAALDYLRCQGTFAGRSPEPRPRLVLIEMNLPGMNGLELVRRLKSDTCTRALPVVILSSSCEAREVTQVYDYGANSCIRKPERGDQFRNMVKTLAKYWLLVNRAPAASRAPQVREAWA